MSRITQELSYQITEKLTAPTKAQVDQYQNEFNELVYKFYDDQIPDDVKECAKKHPDWFYFNDTVKLNGHGFNHMHVAVKKPVISNNRGNCYLKMDKVADQLQKARTKYEKEKKKYEDLKAETRSALLALKTFNNIRKELPQAAKFLPPPMSNALVVNFNSLHRKLNSQPEIKKKEAVKA